MSIPDRLTPSDFIKRRTGEDAETICALLSDLVEWKVVWSNIDALKARIAELERPATEKTGVSTGDDQGKKPGGAGTQPDGEK